MATVIPRRGNQPTTTIPTPATAPAHGTRRTRAVRFRSLGGVVSSPAKKRPVKRPVF